MKNRAITQIVFRFITGVIIVMGLIVSNAALAADSLLYDAQGDYVGYIDSLDDFTLYSPTGDALAYIDNGNIYSFNGELLGWYTNGIVWDLDGYMVAFIESSAPASVNAKTVTEFVKNKKPKPSRMERQPTDVQQPTFTYQLSQKPFSVIYVPNQ